jgi:MFS family permease
VIIAGEAIFMLPFLIPRLYRPLMLESWQMTNTDLGTAFSAYGISSMISYITGGHFADRYHPRSLISISLISTALAGIALLFSHSATTLTVVYFLFGITNIFLIWGALIKVTHISGGEESRSAAMGILDSGRGLVAAIMSSVLVGIVTWKYSSDVITSGSVDAMNTIYLIVILFTLLIALGIWMSLKNIDVTKETENKWELEHAIGLLKMPQVWLLGVVILCAYCSYKSVDNFGIYLVDVKGVSIARSSTFTSIIFWLRPVGALAAGFFADAYQAKNPRGRFFSLAGFLLLGAIAHFFLAFDLFTSFNLILVILLTSATAACALRAVYFSIFGDLNIPNHLVGTVVGIVSFVGFLPDVFYGLVTGHFIDSSPGLPGFQHAFIFTGVLMLIGAIAAWCLKRKE